MRRFILCCGVAFALAVSATQAWAATPSCLEAGYGAMTEDYSGDPAHVVYLYLEHDLNVELRSDTSVTDDDALDIDQVAQAVMSAAEIWNATTRGLKLVYRGTLSLCRRSILRLHDGTACRLHSLRSVLRRVGTGEDDHRMPER